MGVQKYDYQTDTFSLIKFTKGIGCTYLEFDHQGNLWMLLSGFSLLNIMSNPSYTKTTCIRIVIRSPLSISPPRSDLGHHAKRQCRPLDPTDNKFIPLNIHNGSDTLHIDNMTTLWASPSDNTLLIGTSDNGVKQVNIQTGVCRNVLTQQRTAPLYPGYFPSDKRRGMDRHLQRYLYLPNPLKQDLSHRTRQMRSIFTIQ